MSKCLFLIAGAILSLLASPAFASPPEAPSRQVGYADLDLSTEAGRIRLDRRIERAVRAVCGYAPALDLGAVEIAKQCRSETFAQAISDRRIGRVYVIETASR